MPESSFSFEVPKQAAPARKSKREWKETSGVFDAPSEEQEFFGLHHLPHELSLRYQPKYLGRGGEQLVYEVAGSPNVVLKGQKYTMAEILDWNIRRGMPPDTDSEGVRDIRERILPEERKKIEQLKTFFGKEHVLPQKKFLLKVPVTKNVLRNLEPIARNRGWYLPGFVNEAWTIVSVQERAKPLEDPDRLCPRGNYIEISRTAEFDDPAFRKAYRDVTYPLLNKETAKTAPFFVEAFRQLFKNGEMNELMAVAAHDAGLREALKDFLKRTVAFADATGEIIDFGADNIVFFQKPDRSWSYLLVDPLYSMQPKTLKQAREAYAKVESDVPLSKDDPNALVQATAFVRMVNGLSRLVGADAFIDFLPLKNGKTPDVLGILNPPWAESQS